MSFNPNQFGITAQLGELDLQTNPNPAVITVQIASNVVGKMVPGQGVKFVDLGASDTAGVPIVGPRDDDDDVLDGLVITSTQKGEFVAGDVVRIAMNGAIIRLNSSAALARGVDVALDESSAGDIQAVGAHIRLGRLLDKATAANQLVRVLIDKTIAGPQGPIGPEGPAGQDLT
jgi:hypothetical protein